MNDLDILFPKRIIDPNAYTIEEIVEHTGFKREHAAKRMRAAVDSGEWEQVYKIGRSGRVVMAYRKKAQ